MQQNEYCLQFLYFLSRSKYGSGVHIPPKTCQKKNVTTEAEITSLEVIFDASEREFRGLSDAYRHFLRFAVFVLVRGKRNGIHSGPEKQWFLQFPSKMLGLGHILAGRKLHKNHKKKFAAMEAIR